MFEFDFQGVLVSLYSMRYCVCCSSFDGCPYLIFLQNGSGENECSGGNNESSGKGNESVSNPSVVC